ncbi:MAG: thioredoxin family protein [Acidobacteria bacterium]|nr:thioredoxin family protein [Acidobacteriota bacterium]
MKKLQILGTGCKRCQLLTERAEQAARELGVEYEVEKITAIDDILRFGVMATPALAVDGEVKLSGHVPTVESLKPMISPGPK